MSRAFDFEDLVEYEQHGADRAEYGRGRRVR